ncbi:MAG: nicotinate-nucleotide--dimethylbenzimidazole phosphoribosyltransferase, partial [Pseudomonadota bacterium]
MLPDLMDLKSFRDALIQAPGPDATASQGAADRNGQLTKPPGALGRLEELAIWYAGWRGTSRPTITNPQVIVFAGNHGVTAQGVSAFPSEVTMQMVMNFEHGGAAINQLAKAAGARMDVHALDLDRSTADFTQAPAMSEDDLLAALRTGWQAVDPAADLLVVGEMGIGNTTSAAAIACALFGGNAADWTGRGTGVDDAGLANKTRVVAEGVALHAAQDGLEILRCLGGREIAAMAGAIAAARVLRIPVILDGFICSAAAACLAQVSSDVLDHTIAGHQSAESAHGAMLVKLG